MEVCGYNIFGGGGGGGGPTTGVVIPDSYLVVVEHPMRSNLILIL